MGNGGETAPARGVGVTQERAMSICAAFRRIAVVAGVSVVGAILVTPSVANADQGPLGYVGPAQHSPQSNSPTLNKGSQQFTSRNWDGYVSYASDQSTEFNEIKATWIQPTVTCQTAGAWTVFWVGLDGWFNNTVEQGGSEAYCSTTEGTPAYHLWWEMFPTNAIQTTLTINPGDEITADVRYVKSTSTFVIRVADETSEQSFTTNQQCAIALVCQRSSTDVITEDVGNFNGGYFPLANYGTMGYTDAHVKNTSDLRGSISGKHWLDGAVTESSGGTNYASVSPLSNGGTAFSTTWLHQ